MQLRLAAGTTLLAFLLVACGSSSSGDDDSHASSGSAGMSAMDSTGGTNAAGAANGSGGTTSTTGGSTGTSSGGSASATGGAGGTGTAGGSNDTGGSAGMSAMDSGSGGMPAAGGNGPSGGGRMNGASGTGTCASGTGCGGRGGRGGRSSGGNAGAGATGTGGASSGGASTGVNPMGGFAGAIACPGHGDITYTLRKDSNPTSDQQSAYDLITTAMDRAVQYYDCYTNITKAETVVYEPSVSTADGNINGTIRFGQTPYMEYITAMHEIAHTVGVGTDSKWPSLVVNGIFTGQHATDQLRAITGNSTDQLNADTQHFWPYGLNYTSEVKSEADVVDHCLMVVAIRWDMGYDPN